LAGGTLFISRAYNLFSHYKKELERAGFEGVEITSLEKDGLNMLLNETKPALVFIDANFYQYATPFMTGLLLKKYPWLNIAAVSLCEYSVHIAMTFILFGVTSYVDYWDGVEEFWRGLAKIREGKSYISPKVAHCLEYKLDDEKQRLHITGRELEVLRLVCSGLTGNEAGEVLHISRRTVEEHKKNMRKIWNLRNERELVCMAFSLGLINLQISI